MNFSRSIVEKQHGLIQSMQKELSNKMKASFTYCANFEDRASWDDTKFVDVIYDLYPRQISVGYIWNF